MKPFTNVAGTLKRILVKRVIFIAILKRIAEASGLKIGPFRKSTETSDGAAIEMDGAETLKPWGVTIAEDVARVGYGCISISGINRSFVLHSDGATVTGLTGYVGIKFTIDYIIGASNDSNQVRADFYGWNTVTVDPAIAFITAPLASFETIDYRAETCDAFEVFIPLAYIENGRAIDLIRENITWDHAQGGYTSFLIGGNRMMFAPTLV